ncbi:MAG: AEC family transporter [Alphaproteobacteria bacterium]|nr:AEC family transporter [Alphaproteobacteria bacterium]MDP6588872.1 AEC family transporter [Alphaproteobacteria bacterium]MDP6818827.1 AEC family transporter [Alphaproteobacteria bacterium]
METLLTAVVPAFALIAIGYGAARLNILGPAIFPILNNFVYYLAMPALMIVSLAGVPAGEIINWNFIAAFSVGIAVTWLSVGLAGRFLFGDGLAGSAMRGVIASYGNNGYLGIPLAATAFGGAAVVPASLSVLINSVFIMTGAVLILEITRARASGGALVNSARALATNPLLWAVVIGLALSAAGAQMPVSIERLLGLLGQAAAPCALVAIGLFLAGRPVAKLAASAALSSVAKLALFPLIVWLLTQYIFPLEPLWAVVAVLMAGMPVGANAFVIAGHYGVRLADASAAIVVTTAISLVSLSLMLILMIDG